MLTSRNKCSACSRVSVSMKVGSVTLSSEGLSMSWFDDAPRLCSRVPAAAHHLHPVYQHLTHSDRQLVRLLVRGPIDDGVGVEHHDVGVHPFVQHATVAD